VPCETEGATQNHTFGAANPAENADSGLLASHGARPWQRDEAGRCRPALPRLQMRADAEMWLRRHWLLGACALLQCRGDPLGESAACVAAGLTRGQSLAAVRGGGAAALPRRCGDVAAAPLAARSLRPAAVQGRPTRRVCCLRGCWPHSTFEVINRIFARASVRLCRLLVGSVHCESRGAEVPPAAVHGLWPFSLPQVTGQDHGATLLRAARFVYPFVFYGCNTPP